MKMNGDQEVKQLELFNLLYHSQMQFQKEIEGLSKGINAEQQLPIDNPAKFIYHITALQEEVGEVLKADKRWKTHRNVRFDPDEKLDELSDCYITLMNISMWSGFSADQILNAVKNKIVENFRRIEGNK
jgi:NTP pyrophosphatase (non-canonical NTP hydrolase)